VKVRYRPISLSLILAVSLGAGLTSFVEAQDRRQELTLPRFPALIEDEVGSDSPRWIAADLLLDVFGKLRRDQIPDRLAKLVRGKEDFMDEINALGSGAEVRALPCVVNYATFSDGGVFDAPSSLEDLMTVATFAVSGYVEDSVGGFWQGTPATILTLRVEEVFKERPNAGLPPYINMAVFVGEVAIGSARICTTTNGSSIAPSKGDAVFLFPRRELEAPHDILLIDPDGYELVFARDDELIAPGILSGSLKLDRDALHAPPSANALRERLRAIGR
jgi:hypothetical protein